MAKYQPLPHEETFKIHPVGVRYICEFCNAGEMKVDTSGGSVQVVLTNPPLIPHKCTNCGKTMQLPKSYPYVEWEELSISEEAVSRMF